MPDRVEERRLHEILGEIPTREMCRDEQQLRRQPIEHQRERLRILGLPVAQKQDLGGRIIHAPTPHEGRRRFHDFRGRIMHGQVLPFRPTDDHSSTLGRSAAHREGRGATARW